MSVLNYYALQREVKVRAGNMGLSVVFEDKCAPRTDGKYIYLERPAPDMNDNKKIVWWYMFEHELGHNHPELMSVWDLMKEKKISTQSFLGFVFNVLEDHRQEMYDRGHYKGRDRRIQDGYYTFMTTEAKWDSYGQDAAPMKRQAAEALFCWDAMQRTEWMPRLAGLGEQIYDKHMNPQQREWVDRLNAGGYGTVLKSGIDEREEYELVLKILEEVFELDPEKEEQESADEYERATGGSPDSGGAGNESGSGAKGDGESGREGVSSGDDGEGSKSGPAGRRTTDGTVDYSDLLAHNHDDRDDDGTGSGESFSNLTINYDNYKPTAWPDADLDDFILQDYSKEPATTPGRYHSALTPESKGLSKKVKRLLMIKGQSRYEHAQKRGKISPKSLYRTAQGGEAARKVFKKKQVNNMLDTAVTVLMDCSGSMGNHKFKHAGQSLVLLNDAIAPLGIPLEMLGFTTRGAAPKHGIFKSFNKRVSQEQLILNVSEFAAGGMNSNSDGESLLFAYDRLLRQDTQRKILLVLSDGQPACGYGDSMSHTISVVKDIEKQGMVELCSIGILDDTVRRIYSNWRVINNSNELEGAVLGVIKDHIISYS